MERRFNIWHHVDWTTIAMFMGLVLFGWINIYGASYSFDQTSIFDFSNRAGKQFVWILGSLLLGSIILMVDYKIYDILAYLAYAVIIIVLLITPFLAHDIKGSLSWISLGPVNLQPAEFAKCIVALTIAKYMGRYDYHLRSWKDMIVPFAIIGVPTLIIMIMQKETGSALVFASFMLVFFRQGMSGYVLWCGVAAVMLFILSIRFGETTVWLGTGSLGIVLCMIVLNIVVLYFIAQRNQRKLETLILIGSSIMVYVLSMVISIWFPLPIEWISIGWVASISLYSIVISWFTRHYSLVLVGLFSIACIVYSKACNKVFEDVLQPHQRTRIEVLLGLKDDPRGVGYNVNQSKIAIGSGRIFGKGYLKGTQTKLEYVPEQDTDFIFCTVGEEWGFAGSVGVLILYLAFILHLIHIAERQRETSSQIYGYSVASIFLFHLTINVGMVLGVLPVIGIPLPFFSYGGSSLWGFTILLFILLRLDAARNEK